MVRQTFCFELENIFFSCSLLFLAFSLKHSHRPSARHKPPLNSSRYSSQFRKQHWKVRLTDHPALPARTQTATVLWPATRGCVGPRSVAASSSAGAPRATAVRSGHRRHAADAARASFVMSLFMRKQLFCDVLIFNKTQRN